MIEMGFSLRYLICEHCRFSGNPYDMGHIWFVSLLLQTFDVSMVMNAKCDHFGQIYKVHNRTTDPNFEVMHSKQFHVNNMIKYLQMTEVGFNIRDLAMMISNMVTTRI